MAILFHDAYGGRGGIAKFNRDFIDACCAHPACEQVVLFQRRPFLEPLGRVPAKAVHAVLPDESEAGLRTQARYMLRTLRHSLSDRKFDVVVCGHIFLLPVAALFAAMASGRLVLVMHGVEVWKPTRHRITNWLARRVPRVVSVSRHTYDRFVAWSGNTSCQWFLLPNSIDLNRFRPGINVHELRKKLDLGNKRVIFTLGRLSSLEMYKGYDEIIEVLPSLLTKIPDVVYVVGGDGDDRARLERRVAELGLTHAVMFTGYIPEDEKVDYYNLADVFLLAGFGEGFGIVLLEALACGCQVIGSKRDGTAEALQGGRLGELVDPRDRGELQLAIERALARGRNGVPEGVARYSIDGYHAEVERILDRICSEKGEPPHDHP